MEQRDYLKDQIEQMGKVLAQILSKFLGLKSQGKTSLGIETSQQSLKTECDLDIHQIISMNRKEMSGYFRKRKWKSSNLETLSEYFKERGLYLLEMKNEDAKTWLKKASQLLDVADEISGSVSMVRISRKKEIEKMII